VAGAYSSVHDYLCIIIRYLELHPQNYPVSRTSSTEYPVSRTSSTELSSLRFDETAAPVVLFVITIISLGWLAYTATASCVVVRPTDYCISNLLDVPSRDAGLATNFSAFFLLVIHV
jgi:hypothetical protein